MARENLSRLNVAVPRPVALVVFAWLAMISPDVWGQFSPLAGIPRGFSVGAMPPPPPPSRIEFKIPPDTPVTDLLPLPPLLEQPLSPWLVKDLTQVPEVFFQKPFDANDIRQGKDQRIESKQIPPIGGTNPKIEHIARTLAKINHVNQKGSEQFLKALLESRPDLAGLPFIMGEACHMSKDVSRQFIQEVSLVRPGGQIGQLGQLGGLGLPAINGSQLKPIPDKVAQAKVAAWMQILAPEPGEKRKEMAKRLMGINHQASTRALGQLAVFSQEKDVRDAALRSLKTRPRADYTTTLLHGLRYPWPEFAKYATEAMVRLDRHDLVDTLVDFLDEPDPRAPVVQDFQGRSVPVVRELVRLNHHHNCITCHAPATSDPDFNKTGSTSDFLTGQVTTPGQIPSGGYNGGQSFPDLLVRVDVTYLRQDFSLMQKVVKGMTRAPTERFDFLVRTREVTAKEVEAYNVWKLKAWSNYFSPNHQATLRALQQLTGLNPGATAAAWRQALAQD